MTMPRALWLTNDFPPRSGGIEQFLANLLGHTDTTGTLVLASDFPGARDHDATLPYEVRRVARRPLLPTPKLARMARDAARSHRADVVVFGAAWPLAEIAGAMDLPAVALTHGHEAGIVRVGGGPLIRHALRDVDAVGVISGFTRDALDRWVPPQTKVHQLPPGVDVERFHPGLDGGRARARYGISAEVPLVLCLSRLVRRKGQDQLLAAWPHVQRRVPGAHLLLAGGGPLNDTLRREVQQRDLGATVTFTGDVPAEAIPSLHAAADLFAMPCRTRMAGLDVEGLGIVYLEAQATATPFIAGTSGGAPESLLPERSGLVVNPRSPQQIAAAITDLLNDDTRRRAMGETGRDFVTRNYAWPVLAQRFADVLDAVVAAEN